jgi:putative modified peptide
MSFNLSPETADALLEKLATDDGFRALFQKDPRAALAQVGDKASADSAIEEGAWSCMAVGELASKETIQATRDALRKQLVSAQAGQHPIALEASRG